MRFLKFIQEYAEGVRSCTEWLQLIRVWNAGLKSDATVVFTWVGAVAYNPDVPLLAPGCAPAVKTQDADNLELIFIALTQGFNLRI